jgi:predicted metal-dependent hydrolase
VCPVEEPGPPRNALDVTVQAGLVVFQSGNFHAAHDAWEEGWRNSQGAERHLLQALVQLAAAFHQWGRKKPGGAATLLGRARRHLASVPSRLLGVEVSELELELEAWEEAAARGDPVPASPRLRALELSPEAPMHRRRPRCPYCGERVTVQAEPLGVTEEMYVEDCPVCCRPWTVHVTREGSEVAVTLGREDD